MIRIQIDEQADLIRSIEITGHADYAQHGSDIVCAAVSALAITLVNGIEKLAKFIPIHEIDQENGGYLYIETVLDITDEQKMISQLLLQQFVIGVEDIQAEYADYITIERR